MILSTLGIVFGLLILTYSADQFVTGAARTAVSMRMSKVVIGAVVIGFGTSTPELLVSGLAGIQGSLDLAVGNIVGSNIANLTLVLGAAALVTPIVVRSPVLKREALLSLLAVTAFGVLIQGGVSGWEGFVLGSILVVSLAIIIIAARPGDETMSGEVDEYLGVSISPSREWIRTVLGLAGTLGSAQLLVISATDIADQLGMSQGFIGLTVVAIGTSLPELAAALQAARRDETDLIVGNLLGSNLFNAGAVGATAAFAGAGQMASPTITTVGVGLMIGVALIATVFMATGRRVVRWEGAVLIIAYLAMIPFLAT